MINSFFKFYPNNFTRSVLLSIFDEEIVRHLQQSKTLRVALIGGTAAEPEILWLKSRAFNIEVTVFGIEEFDVFLDLNNSQIDSSNYEYDLILCSQVWEHIWNHQRAFDIISALMSPNSILWLSAPAINRFHGSPEYFSAGFSVEYFEKNLFEREIGVLGGKTIGTKRYFRSITLLPFWLTVRSHKFPLLMALQMTTRIRRFFGFFYFLPEAIILSFSSKKITHNPKYGCETLVIARKTQI